MKSEGPSTVNLDRAERRKKHVPKPVQRFVDWFTCYYDPRLEYPAIDDGRPMPSLGFGLDLMRDKLSHQMAQADAVDTKAGFILGSSSLITGVLVAWHRLPTGSPGIVQWLPAVAIGVYIMVVAFSAFAYFVKKYGVPPEPVKMRDIFLFLEAETAQDKIFHGMVVAYLRNDRTIGTKLHWLQTAFIAFGLQIAVVAAIIIVEVATINTGA